MGAGYSLSKFKTKLRVCIHRLKLQINKKSNVVTNVTRKEIIMMLREGKDESARIRAEGLMREETTISAMEVTQMMCDLLVTRANYIDSSKTCPEDMMEACASVIYAAGRMDIPELEEVALMLGSKFTKPWAEKHRDNSSCAVNRKLVVLLDVKPPPYQNVLKKMRDIAALYKFDWKPKKEKEDHQTLGALAKLEEKGAAEAADDKYAMGTLNVTVIQAKELYEKSWLGGKKPFVSCYISGAKAEMRKTTVADGPDPTWTNTHFPFHIPGAGRILHINVNNASSARDEVMASAELQVDFLEPGGQPRWISLQPVDKKSRVQPKVELSFQFMTLAEGKAKASATAVNVMDEEDVVFGDVVPTTDAQAEDPTSSAGKVNTKHAPDAKGRTSSLPSPPGALPSGPPPPYEAEEAGSPIGDGEGVPIEADQDETNEGNAVRAEDIDEPVGAPDLADLEARFRNL